MMKTVIWNKALYYHYFIVVFRQGDLGTNWYAVLSGSLDVKVSHTGNPKVKAANNNIQEV